MSAERVALAADRVRRTVLVGTGDRPCRVTQWTLRAQRRADGERIYVLKDERRARYFRLTERGLFVWEALDGTRTLREVLPAYRLRFGQDGTALVSSLAGRLRRHGFVTSLGPPVQSADRRSLSGAGLAAGAHRLLTARLTLTNVDAALTALYQRVGRYNYTWPAQALWLLLAVGGGAVFCFLWFGHHVQVVAGGGTGWLVPLILVLGWTIHVPIHELQHGLTAKHFGCEVRRAGVGWFWFAPMCWVDTSDSWMEGRWRRIAVSFAGPYSNLVQAGVLSLALLVVPDGALRDGLCAVVLMLYVGFLTAFNPLLEHDGYYMLMDVLETSHLRRKALGFLALDLLPRLRAGRLTRAEQGYTVYGLLSLTYVAVMSAQIVLIYRTALEGAVATRLPAPLAPGLGWGLAALFVLVVSFGAGQEIHMARSERRAGALVTLADMPGPAGDLGQQACDGGEELETRISK